MGAGKTHRKAFLSGSQFLSCFQWCSGSGGLSFLQQDKLLAAATPKLARRPSPMNFYPVLVSPAGHKRSGAARAARLLVDAQSNLLFPPPPATIPSCSARSHTA